MKRFEATPRKFRAQPQERGTGNQWGPADDPLIHGAAARADATDTWRTLGMLTSKFQDKLEAHLRNTPWGIEDAMDMDTVILKAYCEDVGIDYIPQYDVDGDAVGDAKGLEALLANAALTISKGFKNPHVGAWVTFCEDGNIELTIAVPDVLDTTGPSMSGTIEIFNEALAYVGDRLKEVGRLVDKEAHRVFYRGNPPD